MLLKRIYKEAREGETPELDYVSLAHTGVSPEQNFSIKLVTEFLVAGIMEIVDDELFFHVHPEDLHYVIKRTPGRYCLHCGEKLSDDVSGQMARLHVAMKHAGVQSPSDNDPSGYVALNHFECVLNNKQHLKFGVKQAARVPQFPLKEM